MRRFMKLRENNVIKLSKSLLYIFAIMAFVLTAGFSTTANATDFSEQQDYTSDNFEYKNNTSTNYAVYMYDNAEILTQEEETQVVSAMEPITEYGYCAFITAEVNGTTTSSAARQFYQNVFGNVDGTLFLIDMGNREIYIYSYGTLYDVIGEDEANTITDNVYRYASNGDYCGCAVETFNEINTLLSGQNISRPMKYINNILLSILIALIFSYFLAMIVSSQKKASDNEIFTSIQHKVSITDKRVILVNRREIYDPPQSSDSGGSFSGGGGGGGGCSGGGGGGHSF